MSTQPSKWYEDWPELFTIRDGIEDPQAKEEFIKELEKLKAEGKTDIQIVNRYIRKGKENVKGYVKLTADNLGPLVPYRGGPPSAPSTGVNIPPKRSFYGEHGTRYPNPYFQPQANPPITYNRSGPHASSSSGSESFALLAWEAPPAPSNDPYRYGPYPQSVARLDDSIPEAARPYTDLMDYVEQQPGQSPINSNEQANRRSRGSPPRSHGPHTGSLRRSGGRSNLRESRR